MARLYVLAAALAAFALFALWRLDGPAPERSPLADDGIELLLAASWQPGFCATPDGARKPECRDLKADQPAASRFSLHGLWPDDLDDKDIYPCNCDGGEPTSCRENRRGPDPAISAPVMAELEALMPGVESGLHRHEWNKHGACYEDDMTGPDRDADPDEYFTEAMALVTALNASAVRRIFLDNLGRRLTRGQIRAAFDGAFGRGAGDRVLVICERVGNEDVITELWINLGRGVTVAPDLGALILAAPTTDVSSNSQRCSGGKVVRAPN